MPSLILMYMQIIFRIYVGLPIMFSLNLYVLMSLILVNMQIILKDHLHK